MRLFTRPDGRYYAILPATQDLLGDWVLMTYHGSVHTRMGGLKTYVATQETDLPAIEHQLVLVRKRHGYQDQASLAA
jgi:hypothetical protein